MSEIHETTTYVPPTNDDWWIARLLAVKAAWAADQERLRVAEARLVEVEQALRLLIGDITAGDCYKHITASVLKDAKTVLYRAAVLDKEEPDDG